MSASAAGVGVLLRASTLPLDRTLSTLDLARLPAPVRRSLPLLLSVR